jgi:hypothetical protein
LVLLIPGIRGHCSLRQGRRSFDLWLIKTLWNNINSKLNIRNGAALLSTLKKQTITRNSKSISLLLAEASC